MTPHDINLETYEASGLPRRINAIDVLSFEKPTYLFFDDTELRQFNIAINSSGDPNIGDNIFLHNQTTLLENNIGVAMNGGPNTGLVDINCANLINNTFGIQGEDILLNIDAVIHAASSDGVVKPNKFINDVSLGSGWIIFDICYCLLYTSPSPRDLSTSRMPSSA